MPTQLIISRKRNKNCPVRDSDNIAWRDNGSSGRQMVVRSPEDPAEWLTINEYHAMMQALKAMGAPFRSAKGHSLLHPR